MSAPPEASQFRKGQSGNPSGRPRASADTSDLLTRVLATPIPITEAGRIRKVAQEEIMLRSLVVKAIRGDVRASRMIADIKLEGCRIGALAKNDKKAANQLAYEKIKRLFPSLAASLDWSKEPEEGSWLPPAKNRDG